MQKNLFVALAVLCIIVSCQQVYDETLAKKLTGFSFLTYCTNANIPKNNCGRACQQNPQGLQNLVIINNSTTVARVIIGYSPDSNAIIVSFKGTNDITNWLANVETAKTSYPVCSGCEVHTGFLKYYESIKAQMITSFQIIRVQYPNAKVYVTGHSLGGAVAAIALPAIYQLNGNKKIDAFYSFSSPRPGNNKYADYIKNSNFAVSLIRLTHGQDPVVHLPFSWWPFNYAHTHNEVYYPDFKTQATTYNLCPKIDDMDCGANTNRIATDVNDHCYIFFDNSADLKGCTE